MGEGALGEAGSLVRRVVHRQTGTYPIKGPSVLPQWLDPSLDAFLFMLNDALLNQIGDFHCQPWTQPQSHEMS